MKKILVTILFVSLIFGINPVVFAKDKTNYLPDVEFLEEGVYDVKGRPDLKVAVVFYKEKVSSDISELQVCGLSDPDSSLLPGSKDWHLPSNFKYNLNPSSVPTSVGSQNIPTIVSNAFGVWKNALGSKSPVISRGANTTMIKPKLDLVNMIAWGKTPPGVLIATYAWYAVGQSVFEIDTILTQKSSWQWTWNGGGTACAESSTYDVQNMLTHEIGHWFGLSDESDSSFSNSTMYSNIPKGEVKKNTLTTGDILKVNSIYP